jgi:hypothetical protein
MTGMGHEDAFPRPRLSARCRLSQGTFAGTRGNGRDAPIVVLAESEPAPQLAFCRPPSMACAASSSTIALTIAIVAGSAGNSISSASSDRVTSVGVPNTVVVLRNETVPRRVSSYLTPCG